MLNLNNDKSFESRLNEYFGADKINPISNLNLNEESQSDIVNKLSKEQFSDVYVREKIDKDGNRELKISVLTGKKRVTHLFNQLINWGKRRLGYTSSKHYALFSELNTKARHEIETYINKKMTFKRELEKFTKETAPREISENDAVQIGKDLHRTAEGKYPKGMNREIYEKKLQKILHFGVTQIPEKVGYCQGMNFLADIALNLYPDNDSKAAEFYCRLIQVNPARFTQEGMAKDNEKLKAVLGRVLGDDQHVLYSQLAIQPLFLLYFMDRDDKDTVLKLAQVLFDQGEKGYWDLIENAVKEFQKENESTKGHQKTDSLDEIGKKYSKIMTQSVGNIQIDVGHSSK